MSEPVFQDRPVVVLACRVFEHWVEEILSALPGGCPPVTFFDYGLHVVPKNLRQTLQEAIDRIETPSLIVLGYGLCGNGLNNLRAGPHALLVPRTDDCIAILLGTYQAYRREIEAEPGTYYLSKGWLEAGTTPLREYEKLKDKYGVEKADWLMDTQYHNYRRLMLVARNAGELAAYQPEARQVADYCARWGMRYEERSGSDAYWLRLVDVLAAGLQDVGEDFILVPPGGVLKQSQFMRPR